MLHVYVFYYEGEAVKLAVTHGNLKYQGHSRGQRAAGSLDEFAGKNLEAAAPDDGPGLGHGAAGAALAQLQVAMAVCFVLKGGNLCSHAYGTGH